MKNFYVFLSMVFLSCSQLFAQADLYIRDTPSDTGVEPNAGADPPWICNDIWVLNNPDPNWQPYPFTGDVPWQIPSRQNPLYRDYARFSKPNWVYVRVTNRGTQPSSGTEVLKLYWAKASTGISWKEMWNDYEYMPSGCTVPVFMGEEITKPRRNVASLTEEERDEYLQAILKLKATYYAADSVSWWDKQDQIHQGTHVHGTPDFMPWHREFVNRYENLLRTIDPKIRIPYWDWTTDANNSYGVDLFTDTFMGSDTGRAGTPFDAFDTNYDCSKARQGLDYNCLGGISCAGQPVDFRMPPQVIERNVMPGVPPDMDADTVILNSTLNAPAGDAFLWLWGGPDWNLDYSMETNHKNAHSYIGKTLGCRHTSFEDPFVHLLHSNIDKVWAMWQREAEYPERLDPEKIYGNLSSDYYLSEVMHPWDGIAIYGNPIPPWTTGSSDLQIKNAFDPSVVTPPIYDIAGLTIPILQPNESAVIQMPWYPPNPENFSCFKGDQSQYSILARIENEPVSPFGMHVPETGDLYLNAKNNNNIAWENITIGELQQDTAWTGCASVHNIASAISETRLNIHLVADSANHTLLNYCSLTLDLGSEIYQQWDNGGQEGSNILPAGNNKVLLLATDAWLEGINLAADELQTVCFTIQQTALAENAANKIFGFDLIQLTDSNTTGGIRFSITLSDSLAVSSVAGPEMISRQPAFTIYPNPANDVIHIYSETLSASSLVLYDLSGVKIMERVFSGQALVDVSALENGFYILSLTDQLSGTREFLRLVVE